ncbi:leucine-rich repeat neuronal protein 1-like [Anabrus simplex]|uniref:leucine-rich repeat neuronal protein 1-like n=1 Tax=Anabrus simplex TaxID=316456 RepID=UPI0034DD1A4F
MAVLAWPLFLLAAWVAAALEPTCPDLCVCRSGEDPLLKRRAKAVTCSGVTQAEFLAVSQVSNTVEVLRFSNTTVRRVDFFILRRLPGLLVLDLEGNGINEVAGTGKTLPKLKYLDLSGNNLHILQSYAFRDFPELTYLNISNNGLHTISPSAFLLPGLKVLDLSHNKLTVLKAHYFADNPKLEEVYLGNNGLSRVPNYVFSHNLLVLDLSDNHIMRLEDSAFEAINISVELNLGHNALRRVPNTALKRLGHMRHLILDSNPFHVLSAGSVVGLAVTSLSISYHKSLHLVHREAFLNLLDLEQLQIRGNPSLTYLHPQSLVNVPNLRVLDLSNNALFTLEPEILQAVPKISELHVTNNSFACHCSLLWLKNRTKEEVFCSEREGSNYTALFHLPESTNSCAPYIIPLFPTAYHDTIGNNVSFHCRALGSVDIKVNWYSKNSERLYNGQCTGRFCVADHTLTIHYLHHEDSGSYTCVARNSVGVDTRIVTLEVRDINVKLFPLTVTSTFVTLSWNMSSSISNNYMLKYEEIGSGDGSGDTKKSTPQSVTFSVGLKMHSYTVHGLKPGVTYTFSLCMQREEYVIVISTTSVTTREEDFLLTLGIERSYLSAILVSVVIGILVASCLGFCGLKCWRQRLRLQQQAQIRKSDSGYSGRSILQSSSTHSDMAFITYINLTDDALFPDHNTESNLMGYA